MKAVIQRVDSAKVTVRDKVVGEIGKGILVLLGIQKGDEESDADYLADKITHLRIFEDRNKKMNLSLVDISGEMLAVSQFTLLADCQKGRRPSFTGACRPERAVELYEYFIKHAKQNINKVAMGQFQSMMKIELVNNGPVTMILNSRKDPGG